VKQKLKEDLDDTNSMAAYQTIPCSTLKAELHLMDKKCRLQTWMPMDADLEVSPRKVQRHSNKRRMDDGLEEEGRAHQSHMAMVAGGFKPAEKIAIQKKAAETGKSKGDNAKD
jgi:hypothetical protein